MFNKRLYYGAAHWSVQYKAMCTVAVQEMGSAGVGRSPHNNEQNSAYSQALKPMTLSAIVCSDLVLHAFGTRQLPARVGLFLYTSPRLAPRPDILCGRCTRNTASLYRITRYNCCCWTDRAHPWECLFSSIPLLILYYHEPGRWSMDIPDR
jgi:hypothetical protein